MLVFQDSAADRRVEVVRPAPLRPRANDHAPQFPLPRPVGCGLEQGGADALPAVGGADDEAADLGVGLGLDDALDVDVDEAGDQAAGLRDEDRPLDERLTYDALNNVFYIDLAGLSIHGMEDIERLREAVERAMAPVGRKVYAIVNYDRLSIRPDLVDDYVAMVKVLMQRHYLRVTRYTSSTFLRMKLGEAMARNDVTEHHFYRSESEARGLLGN